MERERKREGGVRSEGGEDICHNFISKQFHAVWDEILLHSRYCMQKASLTYKIFM